MQRTCNLIVQIKCCWFHSKPFQFGQVMAKNGAYLGERLLAITKPFLSKSIGDERSKLSCSFFSFAFFGQLLAGKWSWPIKNLAHYLEIMFLKILTGSKFSRGQTFLSQDISANWFNWPIIPLTEKNEIHD